MENKDENKGVGLPPELKYLFDLALSLSRAINIDDILTELAQKAASYFKSQAIRLFAYDAVDNEVYTRLRLSDALVELKFPVSEKSVAGYTAFHRRPVLLDDVRDQDQLSAYPGMRYDARYENRTGVTVRSIVSAPLVENGSRLIGIIQLINPRRPVAEYEPQLDLLEHLGKLVAAAVFHHDERRARATRFDLLLEESLVSQTEIDQAVASARKNAHDPLKGDPVTVLMEDFGVSAEAMEASLARYYLSDFLAFDQSRLFAPELIQGSNLEYFRKNFVIPLDFKDETLTILISDPFKSDLIREIKQNFRAERARVYVGFRKDILKYIDLAQGAAHKDKAPSDPVSVEGEIDSSSGVLNEEAPTVVQVVNHLILDAGRQGVSDIHIEPGADQEEAVVRFRKDGACFRHSLIPSGLTPAVINRIKIMAGLKLDERRFPQSGKMKLKHGDSTLELRVEMTPTITEKEDVVLRLLAGGSFLSLSDLGLSQDNLSSLLSMIAKPYGILLAVGPTGSGKTTTLHAILHHLNKEENKIWTVEDPVEISQPGLRQVQVNLNIKPEPFDFARALRSFLRADPDIIMVGEMRDKETAQIAVEASLTGHLVLSTLHTNSAPETITRLIQMGIDPLNVADSLIGVLAQRLVRVLCPDCKKPYTPDQAEFNSLVQACGTEYAPACGLDGPVQTFFRPVGCEKCSRTGFRGRAGLHELLSATEGVKSAITEGRHMNEIRDQALADGMRTLKMDGIRRIVAGRTTLAEVLKVCID